MNKRLCPICTRLNEPQDTHCWFCNAELPPVSTQESQSSDWLDDLKMNDLSIDETLASETTGNGDLKPDMKAEEFTPDWLQRIRSREAAERAEKKANEERFWAEKQSHDGLPGWLQSLNEDAAGSSSNSEESSAAVEPVVDAPVSLPAKEPIPGTPASDDWLESLKSWQPRAEENPVIQNGQVNGENSLPRIEEEIPNELDFPDKNSVDPEPGSGFDLDKIFSLVEQEPLPDFPEAVLPATEEPSAKVEVPFEEMGLTLPESYIPLESIFNSSKDSNIIDKAEPKEKPAERAPFESAIVEPFLESRDEVPPYSKINLSGKQKNGQSPIVPELGLPDFLPESNIDNAPHLEQPLSLTEVAKPAIEASSFDLNLSDSAESPFKQDVNFGEPFTLDDLPEWLADTKAEQAAPLKLRIRKPVVDDGSPKPEKGKLPVWLASRRPVEAVDLPSSPEEPKPGEKGSEPAKNVALVAAGAAVAAIAGIPVELGEGLKISNRQRANAALLSVITTSIETTDETSRSPSTLGKQNIWRSLLALVFVVVAILGNTIFRDYYLEPELFPEEVVHTFNLVNTISVEKPVLIAGDFEAGFAGEIRLTFQPVLEHLMRRDLNFALLAINPVDSALLEDQITRGLSAVTSFAAANKVVDLGYFPGGAIAIQTMGNSFSSAVQLTADLAATSTHEITKNIQTLADFGAIIVITDKSENARVWIEQIQPGLGNTPLVLITSAQASPLILPYYKSGQVNGLVSGLPGGMIYEQILGSTGSAGRNTASIQLTLGLMASLVLIGGFVCLVSPKLNGAKNQ